LAKGKNSDPIYKLLKVTFDTHQQIFGEALLNSDVLGDIAEKIESKKGIYQEEEKNGEEFRKKVKKDANLNDQMFDASNVNVDLPDKYEPGMRTGKRSDAFEFLLEDQTNLESGFFKYKKQENFDNFVNELACGDKQLEVDNKKIFDEMKQKYSDDKKAQKSTNESKLSANTTNQSKTTDKES
jgi:hypothetical protein